MNNILKRTISGVIALGIAVTSVQVSAPQVHTGHAEETGALVATGIKGDANADGVVTEADLAVYESYFFNDDDIAGDILEDMDISYTGEPGFYAYISLNDYLAVKKYLAGETASVEVYDAYASTNSYMSERVFFSGYKHGIDISLTVDDEPCTGYEIIWNEQPDSVLSLSDDGELVTNAVASDIDKIYKAIVIGKKDGNYAGAKVMDITFRKAAFDISTEDGEFTYGNEILITQPGTYNITSTDPASQIEAAETICISENVGDGKVILNLNGMNINYGDAYYPGGFIYGMVELCDIDIMLSGSNVIRNASISLYTQGQVNIYGTDEDTLSLLGNSHLGADYLTINGGDITVKSNSFCAVGAYQLTMLGGSLDASFSPVEGATDNTSNTSLTGVGMECGNVIYRRGNLSFSGNNGATDADIIESFYVSPLYCDIDVSVSDDGATYTAIEGSPFSDPDNSPSAYTGTEGAGAPDNSVDISDYIENKNFIKVIMVTSYSYKVTIDAGEHGNVTYDDDTSDEKTFRVSGGGKLPEGITITADEGWEIDKITASVNGASPVNVTDISEIVISGDTVITITTKDVKAPVINGITNGSNYCGTITFIVTDDSDVTVVIEGETTQPDEGGIYTIVGENSAYSIIATDEFGNETIYTIMVYKTHLSLSDYRDNGDGTHTGVCDFCHEDVIEDHNFGDWTNDTEPGKHKRECEDCGHSEEADHSFGDWTANYDTGMCEKECINCGHIEEADHSFGEWTDKPNTGKHKRECENCGDTEEAEHVFGDWTDNHETGKCERECENCGCIDEAEHVYGNWTYSSESDKCERECENCGHKEESDHDFGDWEDIPESGQHKRECENCGHTETGDHNFDDWTPHIESNTHRAYCIDCGLLIAEPHSMGECEEYDDLQHITSCEDCAFFLLADHTYSEWRDNAETGKHERECEGCGRLEEAEHNMEEYSEYDTSTHIRFCMDCGSYYEMEAHIYGAWEEIANTNNHKHECLICGYTEYRSHNYGDWTDNAGTGKCERECEDCGRVQENEHNFDEWANNPDTDKHERICRNCGRTEEAEHNYSDWENDNESGKHIRMCLDCFHIEEAEHRLVQRDPSSLTQHMALCEDCDYYEFEDHSFDEWTYNNAYTHKHICTLCGHDATEDHDYTGWTHDPETNRHRGECEICGHIEESEHVFSEWRNNTETGNHDRECEICGYTEEAEHVLGEWTDNHATGMHEKECEFCGYVEAEAHDYVEWTDNHETGKCERECTVCGHVEQLDHTYSGYVDNHESGKHERTCIECGHKEESEHIFSGWQSIDSDEEHKKTCNLCGHEEAAEHTFGKWSETDDVTHEQECEDCGYVKNEDHKFDNVVNIGNGQHKLTCSACGAEMTEDCYGIWETVKEATCTEEGTEEMICEVCGEKHTRSIAMLPHEFVNGRCSSCYFEDPTIGDSTTANPPTGVPFGAGLVAMIPASMLVFFARPKAKKGKK